MDGERNYLGWVIGVALVVAVAAIGYNAWRQMRPVEVPPPVAPSEAPAPAATAPAQAEAPVEHPLPANAAEPLPPLEKSDAPLADALGQLLGSRNFGELLFTDGIVRRIVATVDNLPRERVAKRVMAVRPAPGTLIVDRSGEEVVLSARNSARYARYVEVLQAVDVKRAVALYVKFYPLFQRAYQDLGYPKGYFNDRLIAVIDHLIAAPEVRPPIRLMQPKVRYEYVDPELESLSAGQKIMLRIGPDNAAKMKAVLRTVRDELVAQAPKQ